MVQYKVLAPSPCPQSLADLQDFLQVATDASKARDARRLAAARWAARTQDKLRIIRAAKA